MDEYFNILKKHGYTVDGGILSKCKTPEKLLIELEKLKVMYTSSNVLTEIADDAISEIKMLNRTKVIDKILNNG